MSARSIRTLLMFAAVVLAFAGLTVLLAPGSAPAAAVQGPAVTAPAAPAVVAPTAQEQILTAALGAGADYTPEQATEIGYAADRVCEGITAQVPTDVMVSTVAAEQGITLEAAAQFVAVATRVNC